MLDFPKEKKKHNTHEKHKTVSLTWQKLRDLINN